MGLFAVAVIAAALVGWRFARESTPVTGPILLISIDPLRADRLSVYGGRGPATPHLAQLAGDGVVFTRASTHSASSLPAHLSLLTGQLPFEHGVRDDVGFRLAGDVETLAARLVSRGFTTGGAVSTVLLDPRTGVDRGFTHFDAERPRPAAARLSDPDPLERDSAATAQAAVAWLDAQDSPRLFYLLQLNGVTTPPAAPSAGGNERGLGNSEAMAVGAADAALGSVLDSLRRKGWYDDALVMVTSAHGGSPDSGSDPGRGYTLEDPVRRVALVVKMPGEAEPRQVTTPLQHIDIAPTVLDLVRAPGDSSLRGRSFRGLLEGDDEGSAERPAYAEAMAGSLRFGWAPLVEPADSGGGASTSAATPSVVTDAERDALARLGEIAPTLLPLAGAAGGARPDPRTMGPVLNNYRQAARHDADREFAAAIAAYEGVVAALPDDANAWYRIGLGAAHLGRVESALAAFDRVEALRPGRGDGLLAAARVEIEAGEVDRAVTRLTAAVAGWTDDTPGPVRADAHALLAAIAAGRRRPDEARVQAALAEKALSGLPFGTFVDARLLHDAGEYAKALAAFDEVAAALDGRTGGFDGLAWYRGDTLVRLERLDDAREVFEGAIAAAPFDVRGYVSLATLHHTQGRHDDAVATVDRLLVAVPTPAGWAAAARLWTAIGERELAASVRASIRERFKGEPALRHLPR
ncbi:MAG: sulfatase-like hydrolase/transferase [Vicinamibacterales bacterium]